MLRTITSGSIQRFSLQNIRLFHTNQTSAISAPHARCSSEKPSETKKDIDLNKNEKKEIDPLKMKADSGDVETQYLYGKKCYDEKRFEDAVKYFKMASDKGNLKAANSYAICLVLGDGVKQDFDEAAKLFKNVFPRITIKKVCSTLDFCTKLGKVLSLI